MCSPDMWEDVIEVVNKHDMLDKIIFKSPPSVKYYDFVKKSKYPLNFMPIISSVEQAQEVFDNEE